ncbi:hypothetical protein ACJZ2D_007374 [Fusarium nematophilum]
MALIKCIAALAGPAIARVNANPCRPNLSLTSRSEIPSTTPNEPSISTMLSSQGSTTSTISISASTITTTTVQSGSTTASFITTSAPAPAYTGFATYFFQNGNAGACGEFHSDNDLIVAIDYRRYDSSVCARDIRITGQQGTVVARVVDQCPTCLSENSLDLSRGAFARVVGEEAVGIAEVIWRWV